MTCDMLTVTAATGDDTKTRYHHIDESRFVLTLIALRPEEIDHPITHVEPKNETPYEMVQRRDETKLRNTAHFTTNMK